MPAPLPAQRAIARLWAKRFASEEQAVRSAEFSQLARECNEAYGAPERVTGSGLLEWHEDKLKTAVRNIGAPWYGGPSLNATKVSEMIHFAYTGGPSTRTYLVPLDEAPEQLPRVEFGPCRIGQLSKEKLADLVKPAVLKGHERTQFDLGAMSEITWLAIEEPFQLQRVQDRDFMTRIGEINLDDLDFVSLPNSMPESLMHRPLLEICDRSVSVEIVEHILLTLLLHSWEDFVKFPHASWRPFSIPWIYVLNDDPFDAPPSLPDAGTLSWELYVDLDSQVIERARPARKRLADGAFDNLEAKLRETWELLQEAWPSREASTSAFRPLIAHFLLRAYWEKGIDELMMHMTAIDAAIGNRDFNKNRPKKKKYDGLTKALDARMCALLNDPNVGSQFHALYDRRSEYIHGRLGAEGRIAIEDLNSARRLARRVARRVLEYAVKHPDRLRDDMLADLDRRAP